MLPKGLLKEYSHALAMVMRILDILAILGSGLAAYFYKFSHLVFPIHYIIALFIAAILTAVIFSSFRIYESVRSQSIRQYISRLTQAILVVLLFLAGLAFLTKTGETFSRSWFLVWSLFSLLFLILFRVSILFTLRIMRTQGLNERRVMIIGAGKLGVKLAETVQQALWTGFRIVVFLDDHAAEKPSQICGAPVIEMPNNLSDYLKCSKDTIDEIWIALPLRAEEKVKKLLYQLRHDTITVRFVLDIFGLNLLNHSLTDIAGVPALNLNASPMVGFNRMIKAIEDRMLAALILIMVSPILLMIAVVIKCTSQGPILFKQLRHGWDGRIIKIYKFRTMLEHTHIPGIVLQASSNDTRVTRFGRFLRKTSLDELPQFYNVLQGKMSIVGPRPHAVEHNEFYKESIKAYMQRHKVKPGITGWAQVNGWRGETKYLEKMAKRVEYDLYYIENWSLFLDLKIIFLTIFRGFINKNAY